MEAAKEAEKRTSEEADTISNDDKCSAEVEED